MIFSLVLSPPLSLKVFSQNDGTSCGKAIILPPAADLCNKDEFRIKQAEMWFEFTANAPEHELIVSPSETQPKAEITKLKLFENKCPDLRLRKEVSSQPPELPRMRMEQLTVGQKYIVKAERESFTEEGNFDMCLIRDKVGGGDGGDGSNRILTCTGNNADPNAWNENASSLYVCEKYQFVGLGTSSPNEKLDVVGNIHATGNIKLDGSLCLKSIKCHNTEPLYIYNQNNPDLYMFFGIDRDLNQDGTKDGKVDIGGFKTGSGFRDLILQPLDKGTFTGGKVGIGTWFPTVTLDVYGETKISNNLTVGGDVKFDGSLCLKSIKCHNTEPLYIYNQNNPDLYMFFGIDRDLNQDGTKDGKIDIGGFKTGSGFRDLILQPLDPSSYTGV